MLILLPPSEGKTSPAAGKTVSDTQRSFPELDAAREALVAELTQVSARPDALELLHVGASLQDEVAANTRLETAPTAPAHQVYSGVLYDALGHANLTPTQRAKAGASIVVVSALWGAVGFDDPIPAYRLSMGVALPGIGRLATYWKPLLTPVLDARAEGELVIDARSSTYAAAYKPPAARTVAVDVVQERGGKRKVVSHFAKHTRGELVRHLLSRRGKEPSTAAELLHAARSRWPGTELTPGTASRPSRLTIVLPEDHSFARGA